MQVPSIQFLLWALPIALFIHVIEEFGYPGGFIRWMRNYNARRLKGKLYYVLINAAAILAGVLLAMSPAGTITYTAFFWFAAFLATNGLSHLIAAVQQRTYCPGSVTGIVLFWPLLLAGSMRISQDNLVKWQSLSINAVSAFVVAYFFFSVHRRGKVQRT